MGLTGEDDTQLVQKAARGDSAALATLYDRYAPLLLAVARKMLNDRASAEDLVHDVFLEAWRNADGYRPERASVRTWLLVRLRSRALDRIRSGQVRREVSEERGGPLADLEDTEDSWLASDRDRVRAALRQLPAEQREVLELGYYRGLSSSEIAEVMGSPLGTVKSRTAAGLARLRECLGV